MRSELYDDHLTWTQIWENYVQWRQGKDSTYVERVADRTKLRTLLPMAAFVLVKRSRGHAVNFVKFHTPNVQVDDEPLQEDEFLSDDLEVPNFVFDFFDAWLIPGSSSEHLSPLDTVSLAEGRAPWTSCVLRISGSGPRAASSPRTE